MVGEHQAARELDEDTLARRRRDLGEDHPDTLASADNLAFSLQAVDERHQAARELAEDTLARRRRVLGEDHPDTWTSASNLVMLLDRVGEYQAARELAEDTLARRRRVLGEDHPDTLASAFHLVCELTELGEDQAAWELNEDILARRRRVLGEDHPDTIGSVGFALVLSGLAADPGARALMETMKAASSQPGEGREPDEDTLARRRDLGEDHPDTMASAHGLAVSLRAAGEYQAARELDEDTRPAAAATSARTTPTPWPPPTAWPSACVRSAGTPAP